MEAALLTAAQVFVSPVVGTLSDRYVPAILEQIGVKWDVTEEMEKLSDILLTIQDVLEDAEDKQTTSKPIHNWLRKLKDVAYDVEDLLDECATDALHEPESTGIVDSATLVKRIKQLIVEFDKITEQRSKYNLISLNPTTRAVHYRVDPWRETSSFPAELKVYGRDQESKDIVNYLLNKINIAADLSVSAIVGMGGLGKTTLAQMVYNDAEMVYNKETGSGFEIRCWVCVSENFEIKSLIGDIIGSQSSNFQTLDQLQLQLQKKLSSKRFLLILDDVWNEDPTKWSILKSSLTCGAKGSSIIVTTRTDQVAALMGSSKVFRPKFLSEEDCFLLFKHHAFAEDEGDQHHLNLKSIGKEIVKKCGGVPLAADEGDQHHLNLKSIGKEIVKKCGGVPLAAKVLGGILRFLREEKEWLFVKESKLWDLPQDKDDSTFGRNMLLPALRLSYQHLPQHLRQCFAYCSIFPKNHIMQKKVLVQLWMANGFFQSKGNLELEDIGNGIFNDLLWRNLFQDVRKDDYGNVFSCKMHDLVHVLASSITRDECFSVVTAVDEQLVVDKSKTTRHLAVDSTRSFSLDFSSSMSQSFLRTFLQVGRYSFKDKFPPPLEFANLMYLRVLDLSRTRLDTLPDSIGKMKLLRYLDFSGNSIASLPDNFFCNLRNLQTLKLRGCKNRGIFPESMSQLTNLRHLDITGSTDKLVRMPVGMEKLKCLHMLSDFIASEEHGCGVGELQGLDHLEGTLAIRRLGKVSDLNEAKKAELIKKQNIRYLTLEWSYVSEAMLEIAEALQPHLNIKGLGFHYYGGSEFPTWMNSTCLSSLVNLSLGNCTSCTHLPTLGLLPRLKVLKVHHLVSVQYIGDEFYSGKQGSNMVKTTVLFPVLEELHLSSMVSLKGWKGWSSSSPLPSSSSSPLPSPLLLPSSSPSPLPSSSSSSPSPLPLPSSSSPLPSSSSSPLPSSSRMKEGEVQVSVFPLLKRMSIFECPNLSTIPSLPLSIKYLELLNSSEKIFERSLQNLPHLSLLSIRDFPSWSSKQGMVLLQNLTALQELQITGCPMLVNLPEGMQNLTSLKILKIERCDGLKSLSLQLLTNLHSLTIRDCAALELLPSDFQPLISLEVLQLNGLPNLTAVPVVGSSTLKTISFSMCLHLKNLPEWITNQTLLQILELDDCENLKSLPEGFQQLTALQRLQIKGCNPLLYERCKEDTGEDWHKIAHIPTRIIACK